MLHASRRPYEGDNKRQKWEYQCADCGQWFKGTEVQVDHIEPCGKLRAYEDLPGFVQTLLCEVDNLRVLCKGTCHAKRRSEEKK